MLILADATDPWATQVIERGNQDTHRQPLQTIPQPSPNVQGTTLDGETVLLDLSTGRYYTLNRVETAIWESCTGPQSLQDIHTTLCARFEASSERIADDLLALVTHLSHEGLLTLEGGEEKWNFRRRNPIPSPC